MIDLTEKLNFVLGCQ